MQLSELDLFKSAEKNPFYVSAVPLVQKTLYKVWSGLTKFIRSSVSKEKAPNVPDFGKFIPGSPVKFIPSVGLLSKCKLLYKNPTDGLLTAYQEQVISYSSIASVCEVDREVVILCLKEIIHQLMQELLSGNTVVLNFKVGSLVVTKGWLEFETTSSLEKPEGSVFMSVNTPQTSKNTTFSETLSLHPSNPNPLHQGASMNLNNYYRGLRYKTDNSHLAPVAFYTGQIHPVFNFRNKFTRKQAFEQPLLPEQLLKIHQDQIKEKQKRKEQEKLKDQEENTQLIHNAQNLMFYDKNTKNAEVYERRKNYANANIEKVQSKLENIRKEKEKKRSETYDYFPFTHGDEVESRHQKMNLKLREELQNHLKTVENSPINTKRDPVIGVPKFLQSSEYTEIRRTHNFHVEKVMKDALKTYEDQLNSKEKAKITEKREKDDQKIQDEIYYKQLENERKKEIEENISALNTQIQEKAKLKAKENENKKNLYSTSLEFVEKPLKLKNPDSYYQDYQKFLIEQMKQTMEKKKNLIENEKKLDLQMLATVEEHINLEENTAKLTDIYTKSLNKDIWTKQMQIKALEKEVGKAF